MHIPDGFISPVVYAPLLAAEAALLYLAYRKVKDVLGDDGALGLLATMSAFSFVVMMFNIPIPGGTSGHATGVGILAVLFGPWVAFFSLSAVLLLQAALFGDGGILAFGANAICMGFFGAFGAYYAYRLVSKYSNQKIAGFAAGYAGTVLGSIGVAVILGIQPMFFVDGTGQALYFPLGLSVTLPAIAGSHALVFAPIEGIVTIGVLAAMSRIKNLSFGVAK
jgi:cobalt/nickel transport system permease protein